MALVGDESKLPHLARPSGESMSILGRPSGEPMSILDNDGSSEASVPAEELGGEIVLVWIRVLFRAFSGSGLDLGPF